MAPLVWDRLGDVPNYVEPFAGSLAVLLSRPTEPQVETVNDLCGFICNFWRATQADPEAVAHHADWPVNENDLHARHAWLVERMADLQSRLEGDPDYYDPKIAGWWAWGACCWIAGGWCTGRGPWHVVEGDDGVKRLTRTEGDAGQGVKRQRPHLGDAGRGVNRKRPHLGDAGRGVNRKMPSLGDAGRGVNRLTQDLVPWFLALAARLKRVRVCCGDWSRVCGPTPTTHLGLTGLFLDPPYSAEASRNMDLYRKDSGSVAHDARDYCLRNGANPLLRICLAGYAGEGHEELERRGWTCVPWKAPGGYGNQGANRGRDNARRERLWFSPHCLTPEKTLFDWSDGHASDT